MGELLCLPVEPEDGPDGVIAQAVGIISVVLEKGKAICEGIDSIVAPSGSGPGSARHPALRCTAPAGSWPAGWAGRSLRMPQSHLPGTGDGAGGLTI